jgi:hypothetical protein
MRKKLTNEVGAVMRDRPPLIDLVIALNKFVRQRRRIGELHSLANRVLVESERCHCVDDEIDRHQIQTHFMIADIDQTTAHQATSAGSGSGSRRRRTSPFRRSPNRRRRLPDDES